MKSVNTYLYAALTACFVLTSCEMKNELWGNDPDDMPQGKLEIGVALKQTGVETRAEGAETPTVSTDNFPVSIVGTSAGITEIRRDFAKVTDIPKPLTLPVGEYTISAHSPGELTEQMSEPYYAKTQPMNIQAGITTQTVVKCTMQNCRIRLTYGDEFKEAFKSWTITLDDGFGHVLVYTHENLTPADMYWHFPENKVAKLTANITAVTVAGNTVTASREMIKKEAAGPQGIDEEFFNGGDAINIPMGVEKSPEGNVTDITIKPSINFDSDNKDEFIELPTVNPTPDPGPEPGPDPETPETGDGPTMTLTDTNGNNLFESGYTFSSSAADGDTTHKIAISTPKGLKSLTVTIISGNEGFQGIVDEMGFTDRELVGDTELSGLLGGLGIQIDMPQAGVRSYDFPIGTFYNMLNLYGPTTDADQTDYGPDGKEFHTFKIVATDNNNASATVEYKVTIKK